MIHVGKESKDEKVQLEISEDNRDNQQSYSIAFFDQHCCLSSKNSLIIYFPSIKFHFAEETQKTLEALLRWRKLLQHLSTKDVEKMFSQVDTDSDKKVHALHYAN